MKGIAGDRAGMKAMVGRGGATEWKERCKWICFGASGVTLETGDGYGCLTLFASQ